MIIGKRIFWIFVALLMFLVMLFGFQSLLMPKYMSGVFEGRMVGEYYLSDRSHDVIFFGDCEVYDNISPVAMWENLGITSYVRGSPQQLVWKSYYLLEDTLRYETPKVVFFSVPAMKHSEPQSEAYNRLTLDGMRLSPVKLKAVDASMTPGEQMITYVLPILRYHDRWRELTGDDIEFFFRSDMVTFNGYMLRTDVRPAGFVPTGPLLPGYELGAKSYDYLNKMVALCRDNDIELILIKMPGLFPYWYSQWDDQIVAFAEENDLIYINTLQMTENIGLDFETDTYNGGLGLNVFGAEKLSVFLGNYLLENHDISDHRSNPEKSEIWDAKLSAYYGMKQAQLDDLSRYGEIKTFTYRP